MSCSPCLNPSTIGASKWSCLSVWLGIHTLVPALELQNSTYSSLIAYSRGSWKTYCMLCALIRPSFKIFCSRFTRDILVIDRGRKRGVCGVCSSPVGLVRTWVVRQYFSGCNKCEACSVWCSHVGQYNVAQGRLLTVDCHSSSHLPVSSQMWSSEMGGGAGKKWHARKCVSFPL